MNKPQQVYVTRRLIAGFGILTAIFISFGLFAIYNINIVSGLTQTIHDHPLVVSNAALQSNVAITKMHRHMKDVVLVTSPAEINRYIEMVNALESQVYKNLDVIRQRIIGDEGKMLEIEARKLFDHWHPIREEVIETARRGEKELAAGITVGKGAEHVALLETKMLGLTDYGQNKAEGFINETEKMRSKINKTLGFIILLSIVASFLVAFYTVKHITAGEKELHKNRDLLRKSQKLGRIGSWQLDLSANRLLWSDEAYQIFGLDPHESEPTYKTFLDIVHPEDRNGVDTAYTSSVTSGHSTYEIEHRIIRPNDGEIRFVHERCEHDKDASGKIIRSVGMVQDITERKQTEDVLRKSEQKFRKVLDATPFPIAVVDLKDDNILYWSRSAHDLFGHTAPTASEWYQIAYPDPDYRQEVIERWKPFLEIAEKKSGHAFNTGEYQVTCSDGSIRICELYAAFLTDSLIVTFNDITDRKQAEADLRESDEKYRSILDNSPTVIFIKDLDGKYLYINRMFETIHGITNEQIHGLTDRDIFPRELAERLRENDLEIQKSEKPMNMEETVPHEDGMHTVISVKFPLFDLAKKTYAICGIATDITGRKKSEEALRESEERFRSLFENAPLGYQSLSENGDFLELNETWCNVLGYTKEEVIGKNFSDFLPEDYRYHFKKNFPKFKGMGYILGVEFEMIKKDGSEIIVSFDGKIGKHENGSFKQTHCVLQDITRRKQTELSLQDREAFLARIINQSPFAIWIYDAKGTLQQTNPALKKFLNVTDDQIVGKYNVLEDPIFEKQGLMPLIRSVYEEGKSIHFTCDWDGKDIPLIGLKDSSKVSIDATMFPIHNPAGELTHVVLNWIDITDRKIAQEALQKNEERFRSLFENMYDGVAIYQPVDDGNNFLFVDMNKSGQALSKVRIEEISGKQITEIFPGVKKMGLLKALQNVYRTGTTEKLPITTYKDDRISIWVDNTVFKLPSNEVVALYRDETERHIAEDEIRRLNRDLEMRVQQRTAQLEETGKELEDFVYSVSHDLRAPLRSISGFAQIIDRRHKASLNEEGLHFFDNIIQASQQMGNLIDDLLSFSRLGRKAIKSESVPLKDILKNAVDTLSDQIKKAGACVNLPDHLPVIYGDATLATHIFINLLENAVKYHKPDTPPIIDVRSDVEDDTIVITVADNGIGIARQYHEKIFSIFQRLHSQAEYPGTGIGLAAVKKSLQIMGGEISVESEPGKGSVFTLKIPKEMPFII